MKQRILSGAVLLLLLLTMLGGAHALVIAASSDLHVQETWSEHPLANPLVPYHQPIIDALLRDTEKIGADVLLLTGDISNSGRIGQHRLLIRHLNTLRQKGVHVYVLPGNHDIGDVTPETFPELYASFGYIQARSRDIGSLSYSVLEGDVLILMLDTNGYDGDHNLAYLNENTRRWMEHQLIDARENGWRVLAAGHYPMVTEQVTRFDGKQEAMQLLRHYGVPLYLAGHLHMRGVAMKDGLTELTLDQAISSPCCFAVITMADDGSITYEPHDIDIEGWAAENGENDPQLTHFREMQQKTSFQKISSTLTALVGDRELEPEKLAQMADFFWTFLETNSRGVLYDHVPELRVHPGYKVFMEVAGNTSYGRWIPGMLDNVLPYTAGFMIRDGEIQRTHEPEE